VPFYRVSGPTFVAGVEVTDGVVTRAAPVLAWLCAWRRPRTLGWLLAYAARRGWVVDELVADLAGVTARPVEGPPMSDENAIVKRAARELREEHARLLGEYNAMGCDVERLRAHVAALVREWKRLLAGDDAAKVSVALYVNDNPDLAALAAEAQAREAVVEAAREMAANIGDPPYQDWERDLLDALAALDAARGTA
jgi:uncharacterized protein YqgV (UPF0045/DUF77 family)